MSWLKRVTEEKSVACQVAAKDKVKAKGWKARCKRAQHLCSKADEALGGVEGARDAALDREAGLQQKLIAATYREGMFQRELTSAKGELENRAQALTAMARDLQDAKDQLAAAHHDRTVCAQRLQEMEANYAALREEYYRVYYTLYPYVPP